MKNEPRDLSKLTSVDANGSHLNLIPAEVRGFFRRRRDLSQWFLLVIFLGLPWIKIGGYQSIFLNIPRREFAFFGILFRAHEVPLLFFLIAICAVGLAFVTTTWGRVWCGWACPQTIFIDAVFRRIERWVEGSYIERRKLQNAPLTARIFFLRAFKWGLFAFVSFLISHSFMAYFVGADNLLHMMGRSPSENSGYFLLTFFFTAVTLFDFGWFREQFCVIMCPYGRFQSVMMEPSTVTIAYDVQRGEPRKVFKSPSPSGDCVACNRCVEVCPTGIDIRNGLQMECIACTACADACDEIMVKVKKPPGLIGYRPLDGKRKSIFNIKSSAYGLLILILIGGLTYSLIKRADIDIVVLRAGGLPYSVVKDDSGHETVLNHFKIHIHNQQNRFARYLVKISTSTSTLVIAQNPLELPANEELTLHFFIKTPIEDFKKDQIKAEIILLDEIQPAQPPLRRELILLGPQS